MPPPYPITGRPHRKLCGRLFFVPGRRRAAGAVCGAVCLWDGLSAGLSAGLSMGRTVCGFGIFSRTRSGPEPGNRTGKQGNRETGKQGSGESGAEVRSVSGQWSDRSAAGLQAGCFRGGANGLFCVRRNIYGGFLAPCAITRYIYKSELKKQTDR